MTKEPKLKIIKFPSIESLYPLFSKAIMLRDGYRCRLCGGIGTEAAHIFPKGARKDLALYLPNGLWVCSHCHTQDKYSMHKNPAWFKKWFIDNIGEQFWYELKNEVPPYNDTEEARQYLKEAIKLYERENRTKNIPSYLIRNR